MNIKTDFDLHDKVYIDDDTSITGTITAITVKPFEMVYEVSWFSNGTAHNAWFDRCRLTRKI